MACLVQGWHINIVVDHLACQTNLVVAGLETVLEVALEVILDGVLEVALEVVLDGALDKAC